MRQIIGNNFGCKNPIRNKKFQKKKNFFFNFFENFLFSLFLIFGLFSVYKSYQIFQISLFLKKSTHLTVRKIKNEKKKNFKKN